MPEGTTANAKWIGGTGTWNNTANWENNNQPNGNSSQAVVIHFAGSGGTSTNDYSPNVQFQQILFDSGEPSNNVIGSGIRLYNWGTTAKIENNSVNPQTVGLDYITFVGSGELDPTAGNLTINSNVYTSVTGTIIVYGTKTLTSERFSAKWRWHRILRPARAGRCRDERFEHLHRFDRH